MGMAEEIVNDFMQQIDGKADADCQLAIAITDAVIGLISTSLSTWMPGSAEIKNAITDAVKADRMSGGLSFAYGSISSMPSLAKAMAAQGLARASTGSDNSDDESLAFHVTPGKFIESFGHIGLVLTNSPRYCKRGMQRERCR
jgi:hypothetical protein